MLEATAIGFVLLLLALVGGQWVARIADLGPGLHAGGHRPSRWP